MVVVNGIIIYSVPHWRHACWVCAVSLFCM